ncbi:hypothetical protein [Anaeromusa acidaminophila]|nr:hypothetical protein [Anaeromusa acidaminophila]
MDRAQVLAGLLDLIEDRKALVGPEDTNSIFLHDIEVLEAAVNLIGGPVG